MIGGLLEKFRKKPSREKYGIPEDQVVYAIGDIHGRADLLRRLHDLIIHDADNRQHEKRMLVYLGDYVDRGPYVHETLEMLVNEPLPEFERIFLMGNHEQYLLNFLEDPMVLQTWIIIGGHSTLLSYGVRPPSSGFTHDRAEEVRQEFANAVPESHLIFFKNLQPFFKIGDFLFVHAGIRPGLKLKKQKPEDLYWIRDEFLSCTVGHGIKVIHGHTIEEEVQVRSNRVGIDTGAYATGVLTCAVIEGCEIRFLSTK